MKLPLENGYSRGRPANWHPSRLVTSQWEEVKQRYADGETAATLAVEFGVTVAAIRHHVQPRRGS